MNQRFHLIDALRGYAAFGVMLAHTYWVFSEYHPAWNSWFISLIGLFISNVYVFFVISGFVISYSTRNQKINGEYCWNFFLRRSIRLDFPYWIILSMTLLLAFLGKTISPFSKVILPSFNEGIAQFFYLQDVLGYKNYIITAWTLCLEIQFYLFFIGILWVSRKLFTSIQSSSYFALSIFLLTSLLGLGQFFMKWPKISGLFTPYFYSFFSGVLLHWKYENKVNDLVLWGYVYTLFLFGAFTQSIFIFTTMATMTVIYVAIRDNKLGSLNYSIIQYLGKISYSLYLTHILVGNKLSVIILKFIPTATVLQSVGIYVFQVFGCLVFAHFFYKYIELPFHSWSKNLRTKFPKKVLDI